LLRGDGECFRFATHPPGLCTGNEGASPIRFGIVTDVEIETARPRHRYDCASHGVIANGRGKKDNDARPDHDERWAKP